MTRLVSRKGTEPGAISIRHGTDTPREERARLYGTASLDCELPIETGSRVCLSFTLKIGANTVRRGGRLGVNWRWPFDWGALQATDPAGDDYVRVSARSRRSVALTARYEFAGGVWPYHHLLSIDLLSGELAEGDEVSVILGDRVGGGGGWRAPTCVASAMQFFALVDYDGTGQWVRLPDPPSIGLVPGAPAALVAVAVSEGVVHQPVSVIVRAIDRWGNPTTATRFRATRPELVWTSCPQDVKIATADGPDTTLDIFRFHAWFSRPGLYRLEASLEGLPSVESNPVRIGVAQPRLGLFWGDLHTGQCEIGCGAGTLEEHFRYGRDVGGLQFMTHQANDIYVTSDEWRHVRRLSEAFNRPGECVVYLGCEWTTFTEDGGDHNVIYPRDEPRLWRSERWFEESEPDGEPVFPVITQFHDAFRHHDVLINLHVGGAPSNLNHHLPGAERLAEVHSTHATSEWFIKECLSRGYKVGVTGGSDGVMTRPGADYPGPRHVRNCRNGLTGVYATALTREALWEAFLARRCYATTGERILLWVEVDGHMMGEEFETDSTPTVAIDVAGTAAIEQVDLFRGAEVVSRWQSARVRHVERPGEYALRVLWGGAAERGTFSAQRVDWAGRLEVSMGQILAVEPINFQSPLDGAEQRGSDLMTWRSVTAGNDAGVCLRLRGDAATRLRFTSGPATFSCMLAQITRTPMTVDAGGLNRYVSIGPAPDPDGSRTCRLVLRDDYPARGLCPYWVRVVQVDRHRAWSSPVYVMRLSREGGTR